MDSAASRCAGVAGPRVVCAAPRARRATCSRGAEAPPCGRFAQGATLRASTRRRARAAAARTQAVAAPRAEEMNPKDADEVRHCTVEPSCLLARPLTLPAPQMDEIQRMLNKPYKWGFTSDIESETIPRGLSEDTVRLISAKKNEPPWMLEFRLRAYKKWLTMEEPDWSDNRYPAIDYQAYYYYSEPKQKEKKGSLDEVDPELLATFDKLGIPLLEQKRLANVAVDAVFDSVSIATTFREELGKAGVIFCSMSEAIREYPELVKKYMGSVVPVADNYFTALNSAVFSDGSFCYIPKGVRSPMELSTYFRINASETGQFERTLIVAEDDSYVSYLEGCTAPSYDKNQLHAAVVELHAGAGAEIKYSTVQNWCGGGGPRASSSADAHTLS